MNRRLIRSVLVRAPQLQALKSEAQRVCLNALGLPFEPEFEILKALQPAAGEICIDVGANRGQSIDAIRMFLPGVAIRAYEPLHDLAETLKARFAFDESVVVVEAGLGAKAGTRTLHVPSYAGYRFDGLASLDAQEAAGWLNSRTLLGYRADRLRTEELTIGVETLDAANAAPCFIKIDVQGAEDEVLSGAARTIGETRPVIIAETGLEGAPAASLASFGYEAFSFARGRLVPRTEPSRNGVFIHPEGARGLERLISR
ncbi:MAG: FkbM family methyltransferase [Parvularculaceae bacterium]